MSTEFGILVVSIVFVGLVIWMLKDWYRIRRDLSAAKPALESETPNEASTNLFVRAVLEAHPPGGRWPENVRALLRDRIPTVEPVDEVIDRRLEMELDAKQSFQMGGTITGVGLAVTFAIIAILLADLSSAITAASGSNLDPLIAQLGKTINEIGTKFVVSAITVGLGVAHIAFAAFFRGRLRTQARALGAQQLERFVPLSTLDILARMEQLALQERGNASLHDVKHAIVEFLDTQKLAATRLERQLADSQKETTTHLIGIGGATRSLASIRASVEEIGTTVSHHLKGILKESFGDELKILVAEQKVQLEIIANKITESVAGQLQGSLSTIVEALRHGLDQGLNNLQNALQENDKYNVGKLLSRLEAFGAEEIKRESSQLRDVLTRLNEVLPGLDTSLHTLTERISVQISHQEEAGARLNQAFIDSTRTAFEHVQEVSFDELGKVSSAMGDVTRSLQALAARQMEDATKNHQRFVEVQAAANGMADQIEQINSKLADNLQLAEKLGSQSGPLMEGAAGAVESLGQAMTELSRVVTDVRAISGDTAKQAQSLAASLEQQRLLSDALQGFFPALLDKFTKGATATAQAATKSASDVITLAQDAHQRNAQDLRGSVEELRGVIETFVERVKVQSGPNGGVQSRLP